MNVKFNFVVAVIVVFIALRNTPYAQANKQEILGTAIEIWDQHGLTGFVSYSEECKSFGTHRLNSFISPKCHITFHNAKEKIVGSRSKPRLFSFFNSIKDNHGMSIYYSSLNQDENTVHIKNSENERQYKTKLHSLLSTGLIFENPLMTAIALGLKIGFDSYSGVFIGDEYVKIDRYRMHRPYSLYKHSDEHSNNIFIIEIEQGYTVGFMFDPEVDSLMKVSVHDHIGEDRRHYDNAYVIKVLAAMPIAVLSLISFYNGYHRLNIFISIPTLVILIESLYSATWAKTDDILDDKALRILQKNRLISNFRLLN